jgi:hypothetical protein
MIFQPREFVMKVSKVSTLFVGALMAACSGSVNETESETGNVASGVNNVYQQILSCDNGAAVVDRNTLSPSYPQLVIRNAGIVSYLVSNGVNANAKGEVILTGINDRPVFQASDFHGFSDLGSGSFRNDWTRREGRALRVSFNRSKPPSNSDCGNGIPVTDPSCQCN